MVLRKKKTASTRMRGASWVEVQAACDNTLADVYRFSPMCCLFWWIVAMQHMFSDISIYHSW